MLQMRQQIWESTGSLIYTPTIEGGFLLVLGWFLLTFACIWLIGKVDGTEKWYKKWEDERK